ncbi:unnamed protein product [Bursaphelenchus xylophilus]|uniref:PRKCA-binding protein n=1 Tax=Bursaphelenchus xylophilus TaxID=6326 RepID=A0A1I7S3N1_BURXY|nr:unnamed protein product [Bursaphelenchus xylophilus]CAG9116419.1 unnamed protein product [Bursaphelenchus xylophilus]
MLDSGRVHLIPDVVEISKDPKGHIGIAIGGGAPYCPNLYVVQVFDNGAIAKDGRIHAGDELLSVNGISVRGKEKSKVAKMIKEHTGTLKLSVNRLSFDDEAGQTLDITLKRLKHWWVERMDAKTADAFGLSRAILCNDILAQLMNKLDANQQLYTDLTRTADGFVHNQRKLSDTFALIANVFSEVATRESESNLNKYFNEVSACHRNFVKETGPLLAQLQLVANTFRTYTEKAIPDTKDTIKKYLDKKFEYLSFCLKIKEMDDEEAQMVEYGDYLPRIESGNMEYRIMLRSREKSRDGFIEMRKHVMIKIEMLDEKHVRELGLHLRCLIEALSVYHGRCATVIEEFHRNTAHLLSEYNLENTEGKRSAFQPQQHLVDFDEMNAPLISND